ncbi:Predicted nucleotide-binding protein containing TIR-like domain [Butyrivibrio proteoclasticus]|uniref:Predicted nucleotide-binding protein containing TIR-like domain n=1 Tax=Butyrivibrio proteoclasticus TaxID=43305 RepID=A0A1I5TK47_9FIRM|nr:TIR domain-containing protein [Butyrivibrio proteoclasticus]SFP83415.1 Predicted nucleotide-binding protein containing TIR-like domain [Butyrivibrio proteoclasticus]
MTRDYVASLLNQNNIKIEEEKRMNNDLGVVLKTYEGCLINIYDTGKVNCQGKNKDRVESLLKSPATVTNNRKVFVVYGHDMIARTQLEAMLRRWDMEPLIIDQLVSSGNTIIEKLEEYTDKVNLGIVLATPDDIGYSKNNEDKKKYRVRQNVVLELGMLLAKVGRAKVAILLSQAEDMEKPSDIDGLIYIPFKDNVEETKVSLAKEMQRNGYSLDISKL